MVEQSLARKLLSDYASKKRRTENKKFLSSLQNLVVYDQSLHESKYLCLFWKMYNIFIHLTKDSERNAHKNLFFAKVFSEILQVTVF